MQGDELYINGVLIDLGEGAEIALNKQANNLGELQDRQGDFINTFTIPNNSNNRIALENCGIMTSGSEIPYRKNTATYLKEGVPVITDGEATIKQSEDGAIVADIIGGNVDLAKAIGSVIVGDLFDEDTPHDWSLTNAYSSRDGSQYYIYPFIDWRTDVDTFFDTPTADVRNLLPCCRIPALFDRLEALTGFTFSGSYVESSQHTDSILTPDALTINPEYLEEEGSKATGFTIPSTYSLTVTQGSGYISPSQFPIADCSENGTSFVAASFYPPSDVVGKIRFVGVITSTVEYPGLPPLIKQDREYWYTVQIKRGGTIIAEETLAHIQGEVPDIYVGNEQVFDVETDEQLLLNGQQYFVNIILNAERHSNEDVIITHFFSPGWKFEYTPSDRLLFGSEIRFRDIFRMSAIDVLKDVINLRGVTLQTNSYTKNVAFNFFNDLRLNIPIAINWSEKVDVRQTLLSYKFGSYGQRNWFRFQSDDSVQEELGDYYFDVDDQTLDPSVDVVQIGHPATEQTNKYLGRNIPSIDGVDSNTNWQGASYRILEMKSQETSYNVEFTDGTTSINETLDIPFCSFKGFEVLIPDFYGVIQGILEKTKAIVLVMKLTAPDIHTLDFSVPIELDVPEINVNGYFYINKVTAYTGGLTSCEFVRL